MIVVTRQGCISSLYLGMLSLLHGLCQTIDTERSDWGHGVSLICALQLTVLLMIIFVDSVVPSTSGTSLGRKLDSAELNTVQICTMLGILVISWPCELLVRSNIDATSQVAYGLIQMFISISVLHWVVLLEKIKD